MKDSAGVEPLDAGQQRELEFLRGQKSAWTSLSLPRRVLAATGIAAIPGLAVSAITAAADGPWAWFGGGFFGFMFILLLPHVLRPGPTQEWAVRASMPTVEDMRRGDSNKSWPG